MTHYDFLSVADVLYIHRRQLQVFGGGDGLRDEGLLQSAVEMPQSGSGGEYFHDFPSEMAAAYLFHIVKNHPFVDGNKRTGFACSHAFLKLNGFELNMSEQQAFDMVIEVASGKLSKERLIEALQNYITAL